MIIFDFRNIIRQNSDEKSPKTSNVEIAYVKVPLVCLPKAYYENKIC